MCVCLCLRCGGGGRIWCPTGNKGIPLPSLVPLIAYEGGLYQEATLCCIPVLRQTLNCYVLQKLPDKPCKTIAKYSFADGEKKVQVYVDWPGVGLHPEQASFWLGGCWFHRRRSTPLDIFTHFPIFFYPWLGGGCPLDSLHSDPDHKWAGNNRSLFLTKWAVSSGRSPSTFGSKRKVATIGCSSQTFVQTSSLTLRQSGAACCLLGSLSSVSVPASDEGYHCSIVYIGNTVGVSSPHS